MNSSLTRCFIVAVCLTTRCVSAFSVEIRQATLSDVSVARKTLLKEKMNPLSISERTLLVACDDDDENDELLGFGQIRPLDDTFAELASLYVLPEYRNKGIGTELVEELLKRHDSENDPHVVCLLTLKPTMPFYEKHGFQMVQSEDLPPPLRFEFAAGSLLSTVLGNDLVCMVRN